MLKPQSNQPRSFLLKELPAVLLKGSKTTSASDFFFSGIESMNTRFRLGRRKMQTEITCIPLYRKRTKMYVKRFPANFMMFFGKGSSI